MKRKNIKNRKKSFLIAKIWREIIKATSGSGTKVGVPSKPIILKVLK